MTSFFDHYKFENIHLKPPYAPRRTQIHLAHGIVDTPQFMPVGTKASVRGIAPRDLEAAGAQIILGNTFHLYLRPGHELIERMGGLHGFTTWKRPFLTDSGGYQVFSLAKLRKISEEGVEFRSPFDGSKHFFSPEFSMEIQRALGSDIVMVFDECPSYDPLDPQAKSKIAASMELTLRWAQRCRDFKLKPHQKLFGIVQGGVYPDLRAECVERLVAMDFDGYALGGLAIGEPVPILHEMVRLCAPMLPANKPKYLMGVGRPEDLLVAAAYGMDIFDCVMPTRNARNGTIFTSRGKMNIKNQQFMESKEPLDPDCSCYACQNFSRSYLRHLIHAKELLALQLNSIHNITFYLRWMAELRKLIEQPQFFDTVLGQIERSQS